MRRFAVLTTAVAALALPAVSPAAEPPHAPDCRFDGGRSYESFGRVQVFTLDGRLYGCLTDVGRAYRLETGTIQARSSATRRALFGAGDWVGFPARDQAGRIRARATNLRTGRTHGTRASDPVTALVVNFDGTLAWIAGTQLRTKPAGAGARTLGASEAIDRRFLGLENDQGCAVTWRVNGEQRSSSIHCTRP